MKIAAIIIVAFLAAWLSGKAVSAVEHSGLVVMTLAYSAGVVVTLCAGVGAAYFTTFLGYKR